MYNIVNGISYGISLCFKKEKKGGLLSMSNAVNAVDTTVTSTQLGTETKARPWGLSPTDFIVYLMIAPALMSYVVFTYIPVPGMLIAFTDYSLAGYRGWIGFENFTYMFNLPFFWFALRNNFMYVGLGYVFNFPAPIILALMFNEMRMQKFKKVIQTLSTLPHFANWVVIIGIWKIILDPDWGWVNYLLQILFNMKPIFFLGNKAVFPFVYVFLSLWKGIGYSTILYLASLASIDSTLYEAAAIDGAGRWKQTIHITLPGLKGIILLKLILSFQGLLNLFDAMFVLKNSQVQQVAEVIDTYIFSQSITDGRLSIGAAMGMFKSIFGFIMLMIVNNLAKLVSDDGRGVF